MAHRAGTDGLRDLEFLAGFGGAGNVWGRVTVSLSRRYGPSIDWLSERAGPDELCNQFLPEPGPPDQLAVDETWRVAPASQPVDEHWQDLTLLVPGDDEECGSIDPSRVLEPEVEEGPYAISITDELATWDRGAQIAPAICRPPAEV